MDKFGDKVTDPADPNRCQSTVKEGQCPYLALEGTKACARHGGLKTQRQNEKKAAIMYNLQIWRKRMDELQDSPKSKSLSEEVAILRMTLEATAARCKDAEDLFMMSSTISDLALKIEKVVKSCHSLEQSSGQLMDKSKAIAFASEVVEIVNRVVNTTIADIDLREKIVDMIAQEILSKLQSPQDEPE